MQCPNCGHDNTQTTRFCARCGFDVNAPADPAAASPDPWGPPSGTPPPGAGPPPPDPAPPAPAPAPAWGQPSPPGSNPGPGVEPPGNAPLPPYRPPDQNPSAPPAPYAPPPGQYPPPGGYPQPGGYPPAYPGAGYYGPATNGLAIAALVTGLVGFVTCGLGSVLAIIFGFVSQSQINASQGRQTGAGMAKAGIILGFVGIAIVMLWFVLVAATGDSSST